MNGDKKNKKRTKRKRNILYVSKYFINYMNNNNNYNNNNNNNIYTYKYIYTYKDNERNFSNFSYLASVTTS